MLSSDTEITFIDQVETLGKSAGLIMKTKSVSSVPGDTNTTKTFKMQTEASGSWNDVMYFLSQIENLPYNIHLETVSVHKDTGPQWNGTFDISVTELI
ncbi:TPA: hypothetical protein DCQ44_00750 [Candidatus Taylorbacteria bacterium]|nr:hypothetical protein [Candidatus Taylorbacteria bacterium]